MTSEALKADRITSSALDCLDAETRAYSTKIEELAYSRATKLGRRSVTAEDVVKAVEYFATAALTAERERVKGCVEKAVEELQRQGFLAQLVQFSNRGECWLDSREQVAAIITAAIAEGK